VVEKAQKRGVAKIETEKSGWKIYTLLFIFFYFVQSGNVNIMKNTGRR
jgi:hypothetical protein